MIDKIPDRTTGLGTAPAVGFFDLSGPEGIGSSFIIGCIIFEETDEVSHRRMPQSEN